MEESKVIFNEDQKAVLLKAVKDLHSASGQLYHWIKEDSLTEEMSKILPSLIESYFSEAAKLLNYESHLLAEKERRYTELRKANETIRELNEKLGSTKPIDGLAEQLEYLRDKVRDWWSLEGFNHISDDHFSPYGGFKARFCFMLNSSRVLSRTPKTDKKKKKDHIQHLRDMGFIFHDESKDSYEKLHLIDNETNRKLLLKMLKQRFPSIEVHSWTNRSAYGKSDVFTIWDFDAHIYDLKDI